MAPTAPWITRTRTSSLVSFSREERTASTELNVCLDDDIQLLHLALLDGIEQVIERYLVEQLVALFLLLVLALLNQLTSHLLVVYGVKDVACTRNLSQTDNLDRNRRACGLNLLAVVVGHCANAADRGTRDNGIACMQGASVPEGLQPGHGPYPALPR